MPKPKSAVIFGATSAVAQQVALKHAQASDDIILIARDPERNEIIKHDLLIMGAHSVHTIEQDLSDTSLHQNLIDDIYTHGSPHDVYYFFQGVLPNQQQCQTDWEQAEATINTNFTSIASILSRLANLLENTKHGTIVVVTSVAGDRGRQSNYIYGSAKGALSIFLQGLRNRLQPKGVQVIDIKPGFIDTPMTEEFDKSGPLWVKPERIAQDIINAVHKHRNVVYTPWFWWPILFIIRSIPEFIFKRLKL